MAWPIQFDFWISYIQLFGYYNFVASQFLYQIYILNSLYKHSKLVTDSREKQVRKAYIVEEKFSLFYFEQTAFMWVYTFVHFKGIPFESFLNVCSTFFVRTKWPEVKVNYDILSFNINEFRNDRYFEHKQKWHKATKFSRQLTLARVSLRIFK